MNGQRIIIEQHDDKVNMKELQAKIAAMLQKPGGICKLTISRELVPSGASVGTPVAFKM